MKYVIEVNYGDEWKRSITYPYMYGSIEADVIISRENNSPSGRKYRKLAVPNSTAPAAVSLARQPHYAAYQPEPITVIEGWKLNYNMGNAIKYISRAGKKDATVEGHTKDLEKAINYIRREINTLRGEPGWE